MVTLFGRARGRRRAGERGFTLIELIVSMVILTIVAGSIATIFSVGLTVVRQGGPTQTRLAGAHDLMILEETIGQDGSRAACVQVPPGGPTHTFGSCANGFASVGCPSADLCFGWPQVSDYSCHVAGYSVGPSTKATRSGWTAVPNGGGYTVAPSGANPLAREDPVNLVVGPVVTSSPPGESYQWVRRLSVTVTATLVTNGPSQTMTIHPLPTDPAGASAAINAGKDPC